MTDLMGTGFTMAIEDDTSGPQVITSYISQRDGADNNGEMLFQTATGGVLTSKLNIGNEGDVEVEVGNLIIPDTKRLVLDGDPTLANATSIREISSNRIAFEVGGFDAFEVVSNQFNIHANNTSTNLNMNGNFTTPVQNSQIGKINFEQTTTGAGSTKRTFFDILGRVEVADDATREGNTIFRMPLGSGIVNVVEINNASDNEFAIKNLDFSVGTTKKIFLDGGGNTSIRERTGDTITLEVNAVDAFEVGDDATTTAQSRMSSTGSLFINEKANADADDATYGQFWVQTLTPNAAMFTDDAGTDFAISGYKTINYIIDGGGSAITLGKKGGVFVDFDCEVVEWAIVGTDGTTGAIIVDVNRSTYSGFPTTASIAGTELPTITATGNKGEDRTLTSWSDINAGDFIEFEVDSITTLERVTVALKVRPKGG
jgi:hypothetical protein